MNVGTLVTTVGFWVGVILPFLYLPVFATGIDSAGRLSLFVGFLAVTLAALVVGRDYPETRTR